MKRWMLLLLASLALWGGAWAEDVGSSGDVRKLGPEESKALLKDVGLAIKDKPTYPNVAYRLYPKPYVVHKLATVGGYSDDPNKRNGVDEKIWGPDGEPVVILYKPGEVILRMDGFFSRKRVPVEPTWNTYPSDPATANYRYSKIPNEEEDPGETLAVINDFNEPKDASLMLLLIFSKEVAPERFSRGQAISYFLSRFTQAGGKDGAIAKLLKEIDSFPYPLEKSASCEPAKVFLSRRAMKDERPYQDNVLWAKTIVRYYPPWNRPPDLQEFQCPNWLETWDQKEYLNRWASNNMHHQLEDGSVLVTVASNAVVRLRWEDGEPVGPLPPFIKVIDAREMVWAKLDLLRRYRDEMKRRGIKDATKLRTPTQIMHELAAYFFDIQEIKNWKGGNK